MRLICATLSGRALRWEPSSPARTAPATPLRHLTTATAAAVTYSLANFFRERFSPPPPPPPPEMPSSRPNYTNPFTPTHPSSLSHVSLSSPLCSLLPQPTGWTTSAPRTKIPACATTKPPCCACSTSCPTAWRQGLTLAHFRAQLEVLRDTLLTLKLNLSTFGTPQRVKLGYMGDKVSLS